MPKFPEQKKIGHILIDRGHITPEQLKDALDEQKMTLEKIGKILIRKGWITEEEFNEALGVQIGFKIFDLANHIIAPEAISLIPRDVALKYKVIPVLKENNILTVAMEDPNNVLIIDELQRITGHTIEAVFSNEFTIRKAHDQYYGGGAIQKIIDSIDKNSIKDAEDIEEMAPIIQIANLIIDEAVKQGASDIHIEPEEKILCVRYRIDGMLHRHVILPKELQPAITSRFKIIAGLDIAEKRAPQDGRFFLKVGTQDIDFRVSTCPTVNGENVVLRILDKRSMTIGLKHLGFLDRDLKILESMIAQPYGILLLTGPTGSGKSTTLYAALQKINQEDVNIMTVEDPVEYQFPQIRQVHVNPKAGLTFAVVLRSFLRQDPDVIMVGEIRDLETAQCAVQAALTGHLILSTLHTNDAPSAFTRLMDMGVEPFLVSSSLLGVVAQRLIRKVCTHCKEEYTPPAGLVQQLGLGEKDPSLQRTFIRAKGCRLCNNSGYKGRGAILEVLRMTPEIQELVLKNASAEEIREMAKKQGMRTLREAALERLFTGVTTIEEVLRVTQTTGEGIS